MLKKYSKAVAKVASNIRKTFDNYRSLIRQYMENIELVDPQLKNNEPLVQVMTALEDAWSLGQNQIGSSERLAHLDMFSRLLEQTCSDVPPFKEMVECCDASIFMSIPALLVMETLLRVSKCQTGDYSSTEAIWRDLCSRFKPDMVSSAEFSQAVQSFKKL